MGLAIAIRTVLFLVIAVASGRGSGETQEMELVEDGLPTIDALLEELDMTDLTAKFYEAGFTETRYVLRMKDMDFRMMALEWGVEKDAILRVRDAIKNYKIERPVVKIDEDPLLKERNALRYGRLVINGSTASFEYFAGYFSTPMPRKPLSLALAWDNNSHACDLKSESAAGEAVIAHRGGCSFVEKAWNISASGAQAMILVNNASNLFHIASGYATGGGTLNNDTEAPSNLTVIMVKHYAFSALRKAIAVGADVRLVPLKCTSGDVKCQPILPDEKDIVLEVDSGVVEQVGSDIQHEFLTGTWGGIIPAGDVPTVAADPIDGCSALQNSVSDVTGRVVLVRRGRCSFGDKVKAAQDRGAAAVVVADLPGHALQRMGVSTPQLPDMEIPGFVVTAAAGDSLFEAAQSGDLHLRFKQQPGMTESWLELSLTSWPKTEKDFNMVFRQLSQKNAHSAERVQWLHSKRGELYGHGG